ncbi:MAG: AAA family ATPase [Planctomycetota bacterium]
MSQSNLSEDAAWGFDTNPGGDDTQQRRARLGALLRGRLKWAITLALLLGISGGVAGWALHKDRYESQANIEFKPSLNSPVSNLRRIDMFKGWIDSQLQNIYRPEVLARAMELEEWQQIIEARNANPELPPIEDWQDFASGIDVSAPPRDRYIATISYIDGDPATAQAGALAIVKAYEEDFNLRNLDAERRDATIINELINKLDLDIARVNRNKADALGQFQQESELVNQLATTNQIVQRLKLDLLALNLEYGPAPENIEENPAALRPTAESLNTNDPQVVAWTRRIAELDDAIIARQEAGFGPTHRTVRPLVQEQRMLTNRKNEYIKSVLDGETPVLRQDNPLTNIRRKQAQLAKTLAESTATSLDLSGRLAAVAEINTELNRLKEERLSRKRELERIQDSIATSDQVEGRVTVSNWAPPGKLANAKKQTQQAILGGVGGAGLGFGLVVLSGLFDRRMRYAADAESNLPQLKMLGVLPTLPRSLSDPDQAESAAHAVHHIRTLVQIRSEAGKRAFTISSPAAGSGKSSLSVALGLSFAASGSRTLLVDCDVVGAGLSRRLGSVVHHPLERVIRAKGLVPDDKLDAAQAESIRRKVSLESILERDSLLSKEAIAELVASQQSSAVGLLDACREDCLSGCVATTDVNNLYILTVGHAGAADASSLSPESLRSIVEQGRKEFDVVLIDTGPALGSLEASMVASAADGVIFVVSRGDSKSLTTKSIGHLKDVGAKVLGVVFNHANAIDLKEGSYGSVVSQRSVQSTPRETPAFDTVADDRLGPLGSAVAAYTYRKVNGNGSTNGHANGHTPTTNGHASTNGHAEDDDALSDLARLADRD